MKKTKILMPLAGVAALGAIAPIVTLSSCNKADAAIAEITAECDKTSTYVGVTVKREDIKVTVTFQDESREPEVVTDWTCDELPEDGYHFSEEETKEFTIKYHGHETKLSCTAELAGAMMFDLLPANLTVSDTANAGFATVVASHVYASNVEHEEIHEVETQYLDFKSSDEKIAKVDTKTGLITAVGKGEATITASIHGVTEGAYEATLNVTVMNDTSYISKAALNDDQKTANITITAGDATTKTCNVPEYVNIDGKNYPVSVVTAADGVKQVETLALPATVTKVTGTWVNASNVINNILFDGTVAQWNTLNRNSGYWAGYGVTGAWCYGETEATFANFPSTHDAEYVEGTQVEDNKFTSTMSSIIPGGQHMVGFDMYLAYKEGATEIAKYNTIDIDFGGAKLTRSYVTGVYLNGVLLEAGSDKDYEVEGYGNKVITLHLTRSEGQLAATDRLLIQFTAPVLKIASLACDVTLHKQ